MNRSLLFLFVVVTFGLSTGYYAYRVCVPHATGEYLVGGTLPMMSDPSESDAAAHLYLRRTWYMTQKPIAAWVELVGHDEFVVFVNGKRFISRRRDGAQRATALLLDIAPYMQTGRNSIAVHVKQLTQRRSPAVAIRGSYTLGSGKEYELGAPETWRTTNVFDRRGTFWYLTDFEDEHWKTPRVHQVEDMFGQVDVPPRAVQTLFDSPWIAPDTTRDGKVVMAGRFDVSGRPREGWLRLVTTGPYRLAVNGQIIDDDLAELAGLPPYRPRRVIYDLTEVLQAGENIVSLSLTTPGEAPRVRAELEVTSSSGERTRLITDDRWHATSNPNVDWLRPSFQETDGWARCYADMGFAGVPPWAPLREVRPVELVGLQRYGRFLLAAVCMVAASLLAWIGCLVVGRLTSRLAAHVMANVSPELAILALVPSTLVAMSAVLLELDQSFARWNLYQGQILLLLAVAVCAQWILMSFLTVAWTHSPQNRQPARWPRRILATCLLVAVFVTGLGLRLGLVAAEPMHHDEVRTYGAALGVLQYGYPGGQVHADLPFGIAATSELVYYPIALAATVFDDPLLIVRIPAVVFSMATLLLLVYVGKRCFGMTAGILAGVFYALSPYVVGMSSFGRYFAQLQFFALLTTYLTFRAVHTWKGIRHGYLWGATASFICMYLSWEGSGMLAPPLAIAVLWTRRKRLKSLLCSPSLYAATLLVLSVFMFQNTHRVGQQIQRMWYGTGISALTITPMWRYPLFDPEYYLFEASWTNCALVPLVLLGAAFVLALRSRLRHRLQFMLIVLLGNAFLMGALLPLRSGRYSYHLTVLFVLIAAAAVAALTDSILRLARGSRVPYWCQGYAAIVVAVCFCTATVFGGGRVVRMIGDEKIMTRGFDVRQKRVPDWNNVTQFLQENMQEGDVVITAMPHIVEHTMNRLEGGSLRQLTSDRWRSDYWLQTTLILQSSLGDEEVIPRDNRSGAEMIVDLEQLERIFSEHNRVWYLTTRYGHSRINDTNVSEYLRKHMDVAREDFHTTLLIRDSNHRPASIQWEDEEAGDNSSELYFR